jgi:hypothetical protein
MKTILVFSHEHNTFDKRKMLENPHPDYLKDSPKTVNDFIKFKDEDPIKDFFLNKIDKLLENYEPGLPKMKPDVLEQIKKIEAERAEMLRKAQEEYNAKNANQIILQQDGKEPVIISPQEAVNIMQQQQEFIRELKTKNDTTTKRVGELEKMVVQLQMKIVELNRKNAAVKSETPAPVKENKGDENIITELDITETVSKSTPQFMVEDD